MTTLITDKPSGRYISILSDGRFHETVPEGTEGAVLREYETSDGKKGKKWERLYSEIRGKVCNIGFWEGDYGEQIQITFSDLEGEQITLSQSITGEFGEDIMKKLPALNFEKEVWLRPYSFIDEDTGKKRKGVTVFNEGDKVLNFFWDGEKNLYGYPDYESKDMSKDEWKMYFLKCRIFLTNYIKQNIVPKFPKDNFETSKDIHTETVAYPDEKINPEDVPF